MENLMYVPEGQGVQVLVTQEFDQRTESNLLSWRAEPA